MPGTAISFGEGRAAAPGAGEGRERGILPAMGQLDALRAFAVGLVFFQHFVTNRGFLWGSAGVRLFFVLSGFLITGILLKCRELAERESQSRLFTLRQFYLRRFLRIFPPYYLLLGVLLLANAPDVREHLWWHAAYLTNFCMAAGHGFKTVGHCWSLAVEEQFYLVWPWVILFAPRRLLPWAVGAAIVAGPLYRLATVGMRWQMNMIPVGCLDTLGLGALLALVFQGGGGHDPLRPARDSTWDRLRRVGLYAGLPLMLVVAVLHNLDAANGVRRVLFDAAVGLFSVWLVGTAATGFGGRFGRLLNLKSLQYIGRISYGMYLFHSLPPYFLRPYFGPGGAYPLPKPLTFVIYSAAATALAIISWHLFEGPLNSLKRFVSYKKARRDARPVEPAPAPALAVGPAAAAPPA